MYFCMAAVLYTGSAQLALPRAPLFYLTLSAFGDRKFGELCLNAD